MNWLQRFLRNREINKRVRAEIREARRQANEVIPFARREFYGLSFIWWAADADGHIGEFSGGYGPIPTVVFADEARFNSVWDYFISRAPESFANRDRYHYLPDSEKSSMGLYTWNEEEEYGWYSRVLVPVEIPEKPLLVSETPDFVREFITLCTVPSIRFREVERVNIDELLQCTP